MTGRSLFALGFLHIYRNKRAQQQIFYAFIFSEQLFRENICLKFPLLGSFVVINLKKPQSRKWSTCQSLKKFTLVVVFNYLDSIMTYHIRQLLERPFRVIWLNNQKTRFRKIYHVTHATCYKPLQKIILIWNNRKERPIFMKFGLHLKNGGGFSCIKPW